MHGISESLRRFTFHKNKVDGSLVMDGQTWNPEATYFCSPLRLPKACGGSSALVKVKNSFLVGCQKIMGILRLFTEEARVPLGCVTRLCPKWPANENWALFLVNAWEEQFQPRGAWGSVAKNWIINLFSAWGQFQGNWNRQPLIIFSFCLDCISFLRVSTSAGHSRSCRRSLIMVTDVMYGVLGIMGTCNRNFPNLLSVF